MVAINLKGLIYERMLEIALYRNNGKSYRKISKIIGCPKAAVFNIFKKAKKTRCEKIFRRQEDQKPSRHQGPSVP